MGGYFIKWNRWRHDRVFMSAQTIESVLGPRPKPGTMIRCTIIRLGPDHVPWNRQNPVANKLEHWYLKPRDANQYMANMPQRMMGQHMHNGNKPWGRSFTKQEWEYSGVCQQPKNIAGYPPVDLRQANVSGRSGYQIPQPGSRSPVSRTSRSRSGSFKAGSYPGATNVGSPMMGNGHDAFCGRPKGRSDATRSWRSPNMTRVPTDTTVSSLSRQGTDGSMSSMPALNLGATVASIGSRFNRQRSISDFSRTTTGTTQQTLS